MPEEFVKLSVCEENRKMSEIAYKGLFGYIDTDGKRVNGIIDSVRANTEALKRLMNARNTVTHIFSFIIGSVITTAIAVIIKNKWGV